MMVLCSKQVHLTALSGLLTCVSIALFNNRHFVVRIPKARSTHRLARDSLQLKTCSSHDISFLAKTPLGVSLEDRHVPKDGEWHFCSTSLKTCRHW